MTNMTNKGLSILFILGLSALGCKDEFIREFSARKAELTASDTSASRTYSEEDIKNILAEANKNAGDHMIDESIFEGGISGQEIDQILEHAAAHTGLNPEELKNLRDSLLDIARRGEHETNNVLGTGKKTENPISVIFENNKIDVKSPGKDLSNVVIEFADGARQRFEGLSGHEASFQGTGDNTGKKVIRAWIKAGQNQSGDGPGYGQRFDLP